MATIDNIVSIYQNSLPPTTATYSDNILYSDKGGKNKIWVKGKFVWEFSNWGNSTITVENIKLQVQGVALNSSVITPIVKTFTISNSDLNWSKGYSVQNVGSMTSNSWINAVSLCSGNNNQVDTSKVYADSYITQRLTLKCNFKMGGVEYVADNTLRLTFRFYGSKKYVVEYLNGSKQESIKYYDAGASVYAIGKLANNTWPGSTPYKVNFNANGGSGGGEFTYYCKYTNSQPFSSWGGYSANTLITSSIDKNYYLSAQWGQTTQINKTYEKLRNPGDPTRTGYTFEYWSPSPPWNSNVTSGATYTAQWKIINYNITFNANGGSGGTSVSIPYNNKILNYAPSVFKRGSGINAKDSIFDGWYTQATGGTKITTSTSCTGQATYYAHWTDQWEVNYDTDGSETTIPSSLKKQGTTLVLSKTKPKEKVSNQDYSPAISYRISNGEFMSLPLTSENNGSSRGTETLTFKEWKDIATGNPYGVGANYTDDNGANLKATWKTSTTYSLNFTAPDAKDKVGYKFLGWSTNENAKIASYLPGKYYSGIKEKFMTLYPVYEPIKRTVIRRYYTSDSNTTYIEDKPYEYTIETPQFSLYGPKNSSGQNIIYNNENIYAFLGWSMDKSLKVPNYVAEQASQSWESTHGVYQLLSEDEYRKISLPLAFNPAELKASSDWGTYINNKYTATGIKHYAYGIWTFSGKYIKIADERDPNVGSWKKIVDAKVKIGGKWKRILDMQFKKQIGTTPNGNWKKEAGRRT